MKIFEILIKGKVVAEVYEDSVKTPTIEETKKESENWGEFDADYLRQQNGKARNKNDHS